jgi:hypothetical protein
MRHATGVLAGTMPAVGHEQMHNTLLGIVQFNHKIDSGVQNGANSGMHQNGAFS